MARVLSTLVAGLAGLVVAIATPAPRAASAAPVPDDVQTCPAAFVGATVATRPTWRGVEIRVTSATRAQVRGVRAHVRVIAAELRLRTLLALTSPAPDPGPVPPVDVIVEDAPLGARISVRALRAGDVELLQALGAALAERWAVSPCGLDRSLWRPRMGRDRVADRAAPRWVGG